MPTPLAWNTLLLSQLEFAWEYQFLPRVEGLTDEEYFWEPVPGCWNVRPDGAGGFAADWARPEPTPAPFTTIAWRLHHISEIFGVRAENHFGGETKIPVMGTASEALAEVTTQYERWRSGVANLGEEGLARPYGPAEGPYADDPLAALVLHIHREFLHHAAEVQLLRDLFLRSED